MEKLASVLGSVCTFNILVTSILRSNNSAKLGVTVSNLTSIPDIKDEYDKNLARWLLYLSVMVTESNFYKIPFDYPEQFLADYPIRLNSCQDDLCHILTTQTHIFIIFTGTSDACLAKVDFKYAQKELSGITNYEPGVKGHGGVYDVYMSVRKNIIDYIVKNIDRKSLIITGHSLGGALSTLCALDLAYYNPIHYSFASPLFFNPEGVELFDSLVKKSYRVCNRSDIITFMPLPIMPNNNLFSHAGTTIEFCINDGSYSTNHSMSYINHYT